MKLGLGTVQLGTAYGVANRTGKPDYSEAVGILDSAWQGGIEAFDTAAAYGDSEKIIGSFVLNRNLQGKIKVVTKAGGFFKTCESSGASLEKVVREAVEAALEILHIPYIDYFLLHDTSDLRQEMIPVFKRIKAEGYIHKFGISAYSAAEINLCLQPPYHPLVDVIQIPFNILDQRLVHSGTLAAMKSHDIEIHARSIYLQGLITMEPDALPAELRPVAVFLMELDELSRACGLTRKELAHCYVRDSAVDKMFVGCETTEQLRSNLTMHTLPPLDIEKVQDFARRFAAIPETILNPALWR